MLLVRHTAFVLLLFAPGSVQRLAFETWNLLFCCYLYMRASIVRATVHDCWLHALVGIAKRLILYDAASLAPMMSLVRCLPSCTLHTCGERGWKGPPLQCRALWGEFEAPV